MRVCWWCGLFCCGLLAAGTAAAQSLNDPPTLGAAMGAPGAQLSQSEMDALRARISSCWSPPPGIDAHSKVYVVLRILFKSDGSMLQVPTVVEGTASALAPALAESAKRALLLCQPFTMLRTDHYDQWKDLELKFDPHELLGGGEPMLNQMQAQAKPQRDYRRLTLQLKPGMSEQDVTKLMGEANRSALTTCGQNTGKPWQCKILAYGSFDNVVVVFGQNETGAWLVTGWQ